MTTPWHLPPDIARRYADGDVSPVLATSVEQHLLQCADCRELLAGAVEAPRLDRVWADVLERVEAPPTSLLERLLHGLGVHPSTARLAAATPALRGAWLLAVVGVLTLAVLLAHADARGLVIFLSLAPVLPVLGVAAAFGPETDPTHEIAAAAPYSALRLLAVRTTVVVTSTLVPTLLAVPFLPHLAWPSVAWLLPALALTAGTVALSARVPPYVAAAALVAVWAVVVSTTIAHDRGLSLFTSPSIQLASLAVTGVAVGSLLVRRGEISELFRRVA